ncbi:twin-arginine translocase subunit TatC [Estrella lausannensis]|uniref:Sec-independent protein translocase protein TatC n=1 Tax=Estrella lausannensis TaxID=483423 RepID=A0A0H5DPS4_9BACT|nr:twin-arginine translocase subunit TatC [Estrella lausannensis]CRX37504.1 Sec-independent protein translocase protein tatC [Estrella lausannensis]
MADEPLSASTLDSVAVHVRDLRKTVIATLVALLVGFILAMPLASPFIQLLKKPAEGSLAFEKTTRQRAINRGASAIYLPLPSGSIPLSFSQGVQETNEGYFIPPGGELLFEKQESLPSFILLGPIQGFSVLMKCALFLGACLSSPFWLMSLWNFISPGLMEHEKRVIIPFFTLSLLFFALGALFGYFCIIPPALSYLDTVGGEIGSNLWTLPLYLEFCLFILFGSGIAFEMFFLLALLIHFEVLSYETLASSRRAVIVACFILGALLTPPDVFTQFMLALPLWLLFEICVFYAFLKQKNQKII